MQPPFVQMPGTKQLSSQSDPFGSSFEQLFEFSLQTSLQSVSPSGPGHGFAPPTHVPA
jgi:hypothetical protein